MKIISTISTIEEVKEIEHLFKNCTTILSYDVEIGETTLPFILYSVKNEDTNSNDYFIFDESCLNILNDIFLNEEDLHILVDEFKKIK